MKKVLFLTLASVGLILGCVSTPKQRTPSSVEACGEIKYADGDFTKVVIEIDNPDFGSTPDAPAKIQKDIFPSYKMAKKARKIYKDKEPEWHFCQKKSLESPGIAWSLEPIGERKKRTPQLAAFCGNFWTDHSNIVTKITFTASNNEYTAEILQNPKVKIPVHFSETDDYILYNNTDAKNPFELLISKNGDSEKITPTKNLVRLRKNHKLEFRGDPVEGSGLSVIQYQSEDSKYGELFYFKCELHTDQSEPIIEPDSPEEAE